HNIDIRSLETPSPVAVSSNPLGSLRGRGRQRKIQNGDLLPLAASLANRNNFVTLGQVYAFHCHLEPEDLGFKRQPEVVLHHREQPGELAVRSVNQLRQSSWRNAPTRSTEPSTGHSLSWARRESCSLSRSPWERPSLTC